MADKKQHDNDIQQEKQIVQRIFDSIAPLEDISRLVGGDIADNITNTILGRESFIPGIWINRDKDQYVVGIRITVFYGVNIPQLCYDIQTRAKNALSEQIDMIKSINISVEGIDGQGK